MHGNHKVFEDNHKHHDSMISCNIVLPDDIIQNGRQDYMNSQGTRSIPDNSDDKQ